MAVPTIASSTSDADGINDATISLAEPSGLATDDLIVLLIANSRGNLQDQTDITSPDTYTTIELSPDNFNGDIHAGVYWRIADGTETWPMTQDFGGTYYIAGWALRITGVDTSTPINVAGSWQGDEAVGTAETAPSITTTAADCLGITFAARDNYADATLSGTGWSETAEINTTGLGAYYGQKTVSAAGATGDADWSWSGNEGFIAIQFAIAPAAGATTSLPPVRHPRTATRANLIR